MSVRSGQTIGTNFTTSSFSSGALANADSLPSGTLYVNGVANGATVTVTNLSTGIYKASVVLPTLAIGDWVDLIITATVGGVNGGGKIWEDTKDVNLDSSGNVTYNNAAPPTAAAITTAVWTDTTASDFTTAGSIGKSLAPATLGTVPGASGGLLIAGSNAATTFASGSHLIGTVDTVTTVTNQLTAAAIATGVWQDATVGDFTVASSIGNSLYTGNHVPGSVSGLLIAGSNAATTFASGSHFIGTVDTVTTVTNQLTAAAIATGVWTDATGSDFTTASSIGKSLYTSGAVPGAAGGLFIAGSNAATTFASFTVTTATTFTGAVTATSGSNDFRVNLTKWNGTATFGTIAPDGLMIRSGTAQTGSSNTITLDSGAEATHDNYYQNQVVRITGGTGKDQSALISSYVAATRVATINGTWSLAPDATSTFVIVGFGAISASVAGNVTVGAYAGGQDPETRVLGATASSWNTAGTIGHAINAAGAAADPWATALPGSYSAGQAGFIVGHNLDTNVASRLATSGYTTPPTVGAIATAIWQDITAGADFGITGSIGKLIVTTGLVVATVTGDVQGKVLGGGASAFSGVGVESDLQTIKGQAVTCAAPVTVLASVGTATTDTAQTGDSFARIGATGSGLTSLAQASAWTSSLATNLGTLAGHDPGATLASRTNITAATGVQLDTAQVVAPADVTLRTTCTVADALLSARAQGAGAWSISGTTLTLKNPDGSVFRTFQLDSSTAPTSRT